MPIFAHICDDIVTQGYHIIDDFLEIEPFQYLQKTIKNAQHKGHMRPAKIGKNKQSVHNNAIRNDTIHWLDENSPNKAIQAYFTQLKHLCNHLNASLFLGLFDLEAHFAVYQPGNFYKKHIDQFHTAKERQISCVYYLNDKWEEGYGGALKLYNIADQPIANISPTPNRFVCFTSNLPHEVSLTTQARYSIAAWLKIRKIIA